jgi:hypothetical protein
MAYGESGHNGVRVIVDAGMGTKEFELDDATTFVYSTDNTLKVGTGGYRGRNNTISGETLMIFNFDKVISFGQL